MGVSDACPCGGLSGVSGHEKGYVVLLSGLRLDGRITRTEATPLGL